MPAKDPYGAPERYDAPAYRALSVTPDDDNDLTVVSRGIYVGQGGDIAVVMAGDDSAQSFVGAVSGSIIPVAVSRIKATGTTAASLVVLY